MSNKRILIVEDNSDLRSLMINFLNKQVGISVVGEASNGIEALDFLLKHEVDIMLLDIMLPIMDGFVLLEKMRCIDKHSFPTVIVISSLARSDFIKYVLFYP